MMGKEDGMRNRVRRDKLVTGTSNTRQNQAEFRQTGMLVCPHFPPASGAELNISGAQ